VVKKIYGNSMSKDRSSKFWLLLEDVFLTTVL
jgi:hypothetical protein